MAEIRTCCVSHQGPSLPTSHGVTITQRPWPGGGTTKAVVLHLGRDTVEIWPADRDKIRELGEKLVKISESL